MLNKKHDNFWGKFYMVHPKIWVYRYTKLLNYELNELFFWQKKLFSIIDKNNN